MDFQDVRWEVMDWIELVQDRDRWWALVNVVMNHQIPQIVGNFLTGKEPVSCSGRTLFHGVGQIHTAVITGKF